MSSCNTAPCSVNIYNENLVITQSVMTSEKLCNAPVLNSPIWAVGVSFLCLPYHASKVTKCSADVIPVLLSTAWCGYSLRAKLLSNFRIATILLL